MLSDADSGMLPNPAVCLPVLTSYMGKLRPPEERQPAVEIVTLSCPDLLNPGLVPYVKRSVFILQTI